MAPAPQRRDLAAGCELRIELDKDEACSVKVVHGHAEVFGMELAPGVEYPFSDEARVAVHSFAGCQLEMSRVLSLLVALRSAATEYVSDEPTPVAAYLNLHLALERIRAAARVPEYDEAGLDPHEEALPPRVMVVGERDAGKTTVAKTLVNWALRSARARGGPGSQLASAAGPGIMLVDLDPNEGGCTVPATHTLVPVYDMLPSTTPVHPFGTTVTTGPPLAFASSTTGGPWQPEPRPDAMAPAVDAYTLFYGHTEAFRNTRLAELQLTKLNSVLANKLDMRYCDQALWRNGVVIDTPAEWTEKGKTAAVAKTCRELGVTVLLVVGGEKLFIDMRKLLDTNKTVTVVRVPKSPGASDLDVAYHRRRRDRQLRSYFYGGPALSLGALSPHKVQIRFDDLKLYRVGEEFHAPSSALPIGATRNTSETQLVEIDPRLSSSMSELLNAIAAIPQVSDDVDIETDEDHLIITSPILGFVHIAAVDIQREKFTVLIPMSGRLPRKRAIVSRGVDWADSE